MGQPAAATEVGEVRKALREAKPAAASRGPVVEHRVDLRGETRILDGVAPVALDEGEQDVLAAQTGQQPVGRRVGRRRGSLPRERPLVRRLGPDRRPCRRRGAPVLVEATVPRGDDRRAEVAPQATQALSTVGDDPDRAGSVPADDPGQPQHGQRQSADDHRRWPRRPAPTSDAAGAAGPIESLSNPDAGAEQVAQSMTGSKGRQKPREAHVEDLGGSGRPGEAPSDERPRAARRGRSRSSKATPTTSPSTGSRRKRRGVSWTSSRRDGQGSQTTRNATAVRVAPTAGSTGDPGMRSGRSPDRCPADPGRRPRRAPPAPATAR